MRSSGAPRLLLIAGCLGWALAADAEGRAESPESTDAGVQINGDHVEFHDVDRVVIGHGHVVINVQESRITCDRAIVYLATKDAMLSGRVRIEQPGGLLAGEDVLYNFDTRKGSVIRAEWISEPWRGVGDRIDKAADAGFVARQGYLTTCDFESPHSRITAREVRITPDDRVVLKNAVVYLGPIPVLYVPSYVHRLDERRPHVTLTPGYSKLWGAFLLSSWRYYVHENLRGHIHLDYRERRRLAEGIDTKYRLAEDNEGILKTYYTHEHLIGSKRIFTTKQDPTEVRERYRVQWRHRWEFDRETTATVELHQTKDDKFLQEYFEQEYEQDAHPKTYLQIIRSDPRYAVSLLAHKRVNRFEADIEQLPELRYDVRPMAIAWRRPWTLLAPWLGEPDIGPVDLENRWYYQSTNSYVALYRKRVYSGTDDHVRRLDTVQQVSYQAKLLRALNLTPLVEAEQTYYSKLGLEDRDAIRGSFQTGFDLSTKLYRVFDLQSDRWSLDLHRLRHVITPTLAYRYRPRPTIHPDRIMQFDGVDALDETNSLTPQLEQKLQTKRQVGHGWQSVNLARFVLGTNYAFRTHASPGGQLGNVTGDFEAKPYSWLLLESDAAFSTRAPHLRQLETFNMDVVAGPTAAVSATDFGTTKRLDDDQEHPQNEMPWGTGLGWRWQRDRSSQITYEVAANLGPKWRVGVYERADLKKLLPDGSKFINRPAESEFRVRRDLHEWTVELILNRRRAEGNSILLVFRLKVMPEQPVQFERGYNRPKLGTRRPLFAG